MAKNKMYIVVRGGMIQSVLSNVEDLDVEIIDYDNLEGGSGSEEEDKRQEEVIKTLETEMNDAITKGEVREVL